MKIRIAISAVFFLFVMFLSPYVFAGGKHQICKDATSESSITIKNPVAEIELRPDCWKLLVVADYVKAVDIFYFGKGNVESFRQTIVVMDNGIPVSVAADNKIMLRGNGKFTIRIASYRGAKI